MTTISTKSFSRSTLAALTRRALVGASQFASAATIGFLAPLSGPQAIVGQD